MNNTTNQYLLFEILNKGGWVMYPLLACSLLAVAIILERFIWGPNRSRVIPDALLREVYSLIEGKRLQELVGVCRANTSPIARIILTALQYRKRPRSELLDLLEVAGRNEALRLQRPLGALGTIAGASFSGLSFYWLIDTLMLFGGFPLPVALGIFLLFVVPQLLE